MQTASNHFYWTLERYHRLIESGVLNAEDKVELLQGEIVSVPPITPLHADLVDTLADDLRKCVGENRVLRVQNPITLPNDSEPEPDIVIAHGKRHAFRQRHPGPDDILLLIEVGHTSEREDRLLKIPLYAQAGIREVWLVDGLGRRLTRYREPTGDRFLVSDIHNGGKIPCPGEDEAGLDLGGLFG